MILNKELAQQIYSKVKKGGSVEDVQRMLNQHSLNSDFESVTRPVLKYLCQNHHPHTTIIITPTTAELLEGQESLGVVHDYVRD